MKKGKFEYPNKINLPAIHQSQTTGNITLRSITKKNIIGNNNSFNIHNNTDLYTTLDINEQTEAKNTSHKYHKKSIHKNSKKSIKY